jgi:hypothetical protein
MCRPGLSKESASGCRWSTMTGSTGAGLKNVLLVGVFISLAATQLQASSLFTNFGSGPFPWGAAFTTESASSSFSDGTEFTASASGNLGQVLLPVADILGSLTFGLYTNAGGKPGTLLEQWTNVTVPTSYQNIPLLTLTSELNPYLSEGDDYWFVATSAATIRGLQWLPNNEGILGGIWDGTSIDSLTQILSGISAPALEVESTTLTPELDTWILLAAGLVLLAGRRVAVRL